MSSKTTTTIPSDFVFSNWEDETLNLNPLLLRGLYAFGFDTPSPIQQRAVGPMISKKCRRYKKRYYSTSTVRNW